MCNAQQEMPQTWKEKRIKVEILMTSKRRECIGLTWERQPLEGRPHSSSYPAPWLCKTRAGVFPGIKHRGSGGTVATSAS